jgi:hypothetical protein
MAESDKSVAVVEQRQVEFYGDEIVAVRTEEGTVYVPIRPVCRLLDVDFDAQRRRINRDAVLSEEVMSVVVTTTDSDDPSSRRPRHSEMLALPLEFLSGFLFGINAQRVKEEVRERLIRYQRECYKVLSEAFFEGRLTADADFDLLLQNSDSPVVQAYQTFQALAKLARHQLVLESRLDQHEERLEQLESMAGDTRHQITPGQASQISQSVKAIAMTLSKQNKRNEYGGVYGELYRRFEITSYKMLPKNKFDEAMAFLTEWHRSLTGDEPF